MEGVLVKVVIFALIAIMLHAAFAKHSITAVATWLKVGKAIKIILSMFVAGFLACVFTFTYHQSILIMMESFQP